MSKGKTHEFRNDKYYCLLCDDFPNGWMGLSGLWYHMKRVHKTKTRLYRKMNKEKQKMSRQETATSSLNDKNSQNKYYFIDQKGKYRCALCDASFDSAKGIWRHLKSAHRSQAYQLQQEVMKKIKKDKETISDANLLMDFAEGAKKESVKKNDIKNAIINKLKSLFTQLKNPNGAVIFIELVKNDEFLGELIVDETINYIEKLTTRDKNKIKTFTYDFLETLALIKKKHSKEQLETLQVDGFTIEAYKTKNIANLQKANKDVSKKQQNDQDEIYDTGLKDDSGKSIKITSSNKQFNGGRKTKNRKSKRKRKTKKRRKLRRRRQTKKRRKKRKTRRRKYKK